MFKHAAVTRDLHVQCSSANVCMCQMSLGITNVVHIGDIKETLMLIDIEENKEHEAFFLKPQ